jgi:hypothetical protein
VGTNRTVRNVIVRALLSGTLAATGIGLTVGTAEAHSLLPQGPVPPGASGPYTCCPEDQAHGLSPQTGRGCPGTQLDWDSSQCHVWWGVYWGHGNVAPSIWEGPDAPPPEALQKPWCGFPFMCSGTP